MQRTGERNRGKIQKGVLGKRSNEKWPWNEKEHGSFCVEAAHSEWWMVGDAAQMMPEWEVEANL